MVAVNYRYADDARIYYELYAPKRQNKNAATVFVFHGGGVGTPFEIADKSGFIGEENGKVNNTFR